MESKIKALYTFSEAKKLDHMAQNEFAISSQVLMERAGIACAHLLRKYLDCDSRVLILAGSGNNGGDALVLARELYNMGIVIELVLRAQPKTKQSKENLSILQALGIQFSLVQDEGIRKYTENLRPQDWIVDGIVGIGLQSQFRDKKLIEAVNSSCARVFAIDVPTGLLELEYLPHYEEEVLVDSDITATIGVEKIAMYAPEQRSYCGEIILLDSVFPKAIVQNISPVAYKLDVSLWEDLRLVMKNDLYKLTRGVVGLCVGSEKYPGAALVATLAASKGPAGMHYVYTDHRIKELILAQCPFAIYDEDICNNSTVHALLLGSGWGEKNKEALESLLGIDIPSVLDADALNILAQNHVDLIPKLKCRNSTSVCTPHLGELTRLCTSIQPESHGIHSFAMARQISEHTHTIVCAKNSVTMICSPHALPVIIDGNTPSLAIGGSGDILAAYMASVLAFLTAQCSSRSRYRHEFIDTILERMRIMIPSYCNREDDIDLNVAMYSCIVAVLAHQRSGIQIQDKDMLANSTDIIQSIPSCVQYKGF